jgi:hypothetical protein
MFISWKREPIYIKRMLEPATRGVSIKIYIKEYLSRRWQDASVQDIRAQKVDLMTYKGYSDCYLDWRKYIEEQSKLLADEE